MKRVFNAIWQLISYLFWPQWGFNKKVKKLLAMICALLKADMHFKFLKGAWHTVIVNEPCIIFETKDRAYESLKKEDIFKRDAK